MPLRQPDIWPKATSLGWPTGVANAKNILALCAAHIARLEQERDKLVIAIGGTRSYRAE